MGVIGAALKLLAKVPWWLWAVAGLILWGWAGHNRANTIEHDVAVKTQQSEKEQRDEERRRNEQHVKVLDKAVAEREQSRLAADRARAAEQRLRKQLEQQARAGREAGSDPAAAAGWRAAETLGKVLGECVSRYRELGEEADRARDAGLTCERAYDALSGPAD
jgi:hypothetical protein